MFDIFVRKVYELEQNAQDFFNKELVDNARETIATDTFNDWIKNNRELKFNEIVSFKIPLCLGGKDELENYEIIDHEVDWEINRQLIEKIK